MVVNTMESLKDKIYKLLDNLEIYEEQEQVNDLSDQIVDIVKKWLKAGLTDNSYFLLLDEHK